MTAPAPPRARPVVVAAAALFVVLVCGSGVFALLSEVMNHTVERTSTFTPATSRVQIDADGDVVVGPSSDGQVHVHTRVRYGLGEPDLVEESTPAGIRLDASCTEFPAGPCDVRYAIEVPPSFEVAIDGADGDVTASRLSGPLTIDRVTGDITVLDLTGRLDLRSATGEINGESLRTEVLRADSDTGDLRLELLVAPQSVDATTETGEITLAVPADTTYRVDAGSDSGDERVLVPLDPASTRTLHASSDTGDVTVRPTR